MSTRTVTLVEFSAPGSFYDESTSRKVNSDCAICEAIELSQGIELRYGALPYGFRFVRQIVADPIDDGFGGKLDVIPKVIDTSPMHFIGGTVENYDQIYERKEENERILLSNMRGNNWPFVITVTNRYKITKPFEQNAILVDPKTRNVELRGWSDEMRRYAERFKQRYDAGTLP